MYMQVSHLDRFGAGTGYVPFSIPRDVCHCQTLPPQSPKAKRIAKVRATLASPCLALTWGARGRGCE